MPVVVDVHVVEYSETYICDVVVDVVVTCNVGVTPAGLHSLALSGDHSVGLNYASFMVGRVRYLSGSNAMIPSCSA